MRAPAGDPGRAPAGPICAAITFNLYVDYRRESRIFSNMVERHPQMDDLFQALAHGARRNMLRRLAGHELTVGELAAPLDMSLAAASRHIQVLEHAGLVRRTVQGRRHLCRLNPGPLESAAAWLRFYERFWTERLDALDTLLAVPPPLDPE
jgi:DNA-binding transcriptional ArsR family regulator